MVEDHILQHQHLLLQLRCLGHERVVHGLDGDLLVLQLRDAALFPLATLLSGLSVSEAQLGLAI
jgi:hypothetical protein